MSASSQATAGPGRGTGYRLAARLARREVLRRPGRTLLVALLVALPVAGMFVADAMVRTDHFTPLQEWRSQSGLADAVFNPVDASARARLLAALPSGTHIAEARPYFDSRVLRAAGGHTARVDISLLPLQDHITDGIVDLMSGRLPARPGEIFLGRAAAKKLHVHAGDTLHLTKPVRHDFVVAGVGEMAAGWGQPVLIAMPGTTLPWPAPSGVAPPTLLIGLPAHADPHALVPLAAHWNSANEVLTLSPTIAPRSFDYAAADAQRKVRWSWVVGALVLTVAGIVIASAFAMGARRQLVTVGQLAANGAPPKTVRRVLFLQGTWTGIVGAVGGLGLAALALVVLAPHVDEIFKRSVNAYTIVPFDVVPIALLGVATATIAALLPARTTSRLPVLAALAGRRPLGRVPRWLPIAGACAAAGGLALLGLAVLGSNGVGAGHPQVWAATAVVGGVAVLLGACAIAPMYVSVLEPLATRAQGPQRIAVRSLARQRTRTGAVVSAIAATGALAIAASSLVLSSHLQNERAALYVRPTDVQLSAYHEKSTSLVPPPALVAAAKKTLRGATVFRLETPTRANVQWSIQNIVPDHPGMSGTAIDDQSFDPSNETPVAIATPAAVAAYGLRAGDQSKLERAGALFLESESGHAVIGLVVHQGAKTLPHPKRFTAAMIDGRHYLLGSLPNLLVTPALARRLGMQAEPGPVVLRAPKRLTEAQRNDIQSLYDEGIASGNGANATASITYYQPPGGVDPLLIQWALVGVALVMVLFVVAVNLALSAAETRDERDVLTIVGAAPTAMRRASGYKAALLTVMGSALAVPVGFLPVVVFVAAEHSSRPLVFPWALVALLVIGLPAVGGLITTAASGVALRLRPVRVSTMAYD